MRVFLRQCIKFCLLTFRDHAFFIFKYKVGTSDHGTFLIDLRSDSVCNNVLDFAVHLVMFKITLLCSVCHCFCHGMREMLL